MHGDMYDDYEDDDGNVGLAFGQGFFARSAIAVEEDTNEIISYMMPHYKVTVQAFLVDDFNSADDLGVEIIPNVEKGVSYLRIDQNLWDFIEDVAHCEHEASFYQGLVLGQLLVGTAHRMVSDMTGRLPDH